MWTYNIRGKGLNKGNLSVTVDYTNGVDQFTETYFPQNLDQLKKTIKQQLDICDASENLNLEFGNGQIDLTIEEIVDTPVAKPIKTAEQEYEQKRGQLQKAKEDLDLGLIEKADYDTLLNEVKLLKK